MFRPLSVGVALWAVAIVLGVGWLAQRTSEGSFDWRATRDLLANHQLRETDIVGPKERHKLAKLMGRKELVGKHLLVAKRKDAPIGATDVGLQPRLAVGEAGSGVLYYPLKGEERLADGVEVGSWVLPCFSRLAKDADRPPVTHCAKVALAVEVVHRPISETDPMWLGLRIPQCRTQEVGEFLSRSNRFFLLAAHRP